MSSRKQKLEGMEKMFLREQELDDKVRALEIKLAYLEGVLYMLLVSLPVFVFLILRTIFTPFYPQHLSHIPRT